MTWLRPEIGPRYCIFSAIRGFQEQVSRRGREGFRSSLVAGRVSVIHRLVESQYGKLQGGRLCRMRRQLHEATRG